MKKEGVQKDGDRWVLVWDHDDQFFLNMPFCLKGIFPVSMGGKLGDYFIIGTRTEQVYLFYAAYCLMTHQKTVRD